MKHLPILKFELILIEKISNREHNKAEQSIPCFKPPLCFDISRVKVILLKNETNVHFKIFFFIFDVHFNHLYLFYIKILCNTVMKESNENNNNSKVFVNKTSSRTYSNNISSINIARNYVDKVTSIKYFRASSNFWNNAIKT